MTLNLASILDVNARNRPHDPAVIAGDVMLDYATIAERTRRMAGQLVRYGIKPGNRVGLCLSDSIDHILMHFAVARLGACIVPIDHRWTGAEIDKVKQAFACDLVAYEPGATSLPMGRSVALAPDWYAEPCPVPPAVSDEALPVVLSLSSGTTGRPTGALVTHRQLYERFVSQWVTMRFNGGDRYMVATPLYFGGGRSFAMSFLSVGATLILCPPPQEPQALIDLAARHRASVTFLVPTQNSAPADELDRGRTGFPYVASAGDERRGHPRRGASRSNGTPIARVHGLLRVERRWGRGRSATRGAACLSRHSRPANLPG